MLFRLQPKDDFDLTNSDTNDPLKAFTIEPQTGTSLLVGTLEEAYQKIFEKIANQRILTNWVRLWSFFGINSQKAAITSTMREKFIRMFSDKKFYSNVCNYLFLVAFCSFLIRYEPSSTQSFSVVVLAGIH